MATRSFVNDQQVDRPGAGVVQVQEAWATGRGEADRQGGWHVREEAVMGTSVRAELWGRRPDEAAAALAAVMAEMHRIDRAMSPHRPDSELSRINREAAARDLPLSEEMFDLLSRAIGFSRLSGGAFDITYAAAGHLYDYREKRRPTDEALGRACAAVGWQNLRLDARAGTVRFAVEGMRIDLGGFAKGLAVDRCAGILRGLGIQHAIVSAGGDSRVIGDRRGRPWTVAIRDPRRPGEIAAVLPLEDVAISTSGDYERYFDAADGVRCHHILDPRTGKSPAALRSVTILAPDGLTSEALSKSLFVMGIERGMALVESQEGVDAVAIDAAGTLHASSGLTDHGAPGPLQ
jgi:thiamine biosynthesis lipoprotein